MTHRMPAECAAPGSALAQLFLALVCLGLTACQSTSPQSARTYSGDDAVDFTGYWIPDERRAQPWPPTLPLTPAARSSMEQFDPASHDPTSFCLPFGTPRNMLQTEYPVQMVQTPQRLLMIVQPNLANSEVRRIAIGAPEPSEAPEPTWFGTSRGRWEGSTLVVETVGLRADAVLSGNGLPQSEELRVVERLSIVNDPERGKVLVNEIELHDPKSFTAPLRTRRYFVWAPHVPMFEGNCVARRWIDKLWRDRLEEHAQQAREAEGTK